LNLNNNKLIVKNYLFLAWDGYYFRGTLVAKSNPESFDFAGMVVEKWNDSLRDKDEETKAVFVEFSFNEILLIRIDGKDVSEKNKIFNYNSSNINASDHQELLQMLRHL